MTVQFAESTSRRSEHRPVITWNRTDLQVSSLA